MNDLISRQAAIDAMEGLPKYFDKTDTLCLDYADVLAVLSEHIPSAQPEPDHDLIHLQKEQAYMQGWEDGRKSECTAVARMEYRMNDLISRQAAIDEGKEWIDAVYFEENDKRERKAIECFIGSLKNMPSAQQWIPCSERLPEIDKEVLVTDGEIYWVCSLFESPDIEDGLYQWEDNYGHWHEFETWVAWMPLPEPYKGE